MPSDTSPKFQVEISFSNGDWNSLATFDTNVVACTVYLTGPSTPYLGVCVPALHNPDEVVGTNPADFVGTVAYVRMGMNMPISFVVDPGGLGHVWVKRVGGGGVSEITAFCIPMLVGRGSSRMADPNMGFTGNRNKANASGW